MHSSKTHDQPKEFISVFHWLLYVRSDPWFRSKFELLCVNFFQWSMMNNCGIGFLVKSVKFDIVSL